MKLGGIIPALVTPFDGRGEVNTSSLRTLVNRLVREGVGGFYVCGSTGEGLLLEEWERKQVLETVVDETNGSVPVVAHVGALSTRQAIRLAVHAKECGADAVSSIPPLYYPYGLNEIAGYYQAIAKASGLPLVIYNIPKLSGVSFTSENIGMLLEACDAWGLKFTSYNLYELDKIHRKYPNLKLFNGHEEILLNALPLDVEGAIGSSFNFMAGRFLTICDHYQNRELEQAEQAQREANRLVDTMVECGGVRAVKYLLTRQGIACGEAREPFGRLTDEQKRKLDRIL